MVRKGLPLKLIVAKGIKAIRKSGRKDLTPYAERLEAAQKENNIDEVGKVLAELATYLQSGSGVKM